MDDAEHDGLAGEGADVGERAPVDWRSKAEYCLAVDGDDRVAGDEPGALRRRARHDLVERDADRRLAPQGDAGEDRERQSSRFIVTPASRMPTLTHSLAFANECGSASSLPSSPSSFTKPPIGSQLSVYRVAPASSSLARATARND